MKSLQHTSFKTMLQYTPEEIKYFLELAAKLKADKKKGNKVFFAYSLMEKPVDGNTLDRTCVSAYKFICIILWN